VRDHSPSHCTLTLERELTEASDCPSPESGVVVVATLPRSDHLGINRDEMEARPRKTGAGAEGWSGSNASGTSPDPRATHREWPPWSFSEYAR